METPIDGPNCFLKPQSLACKMNNRITALDASDAEAYEEWADASFELTFGYHEDVATLVYGDPHPDDAEDHPLEDFGVTQSPEQQARFEIALRKRMN